MSHTGILDRDYTAFCQEVLSQPRVKSASTENATNKRRSHNENRQERDFNCKAFVDVSTEMISQFFE
jgi:hypothetical protein